MNTEGVTNMKRRILSILCALALCLGLLPTVALAGNPTTLTVGGTDVQSGGYWKTNTDGTLTADMASADNYNVYYDGDGTLTLKDATINGTNTIGHVGAGIFASGDLTIVLEGSSTVKGVQDPNGESQSIRVSENLTIQGGGSLTAQGAETSSGSSYGIFVIGSFTQQGGSVTASGGDVSGSYNSTGLYVYGSTVTVQGGTLTATGGTTGSGSYGISANGSVTVSDATVTATSGSAGYASYGLYIGSSSPSVTLSGSSSLTARSGTATNRAGGIYFQNPFGSAGSVTVGENSTLLANSVILYDNSFEAKPLAPTGDGSWLIYGQSGQTSAVGGNYTLTDDLTIENGNTFTIPAGSTLTVPQGKTLTVDGTLNIANQSSLTGSGSLAGSGAFNLTNPDPVISGSETLTYDGTDHFNDFSLTAPTGTVKVMEKDFTISSSPSLVGWSLETKEIKNAGTYTLTAKNSDGSRTVQKQVTVSKATSTIAFNNYALSYTYTGQPLANPTAEQLTLTGAGYDDVTFTWYEGTSPNGTKLDSAPTDAGTYYLVASIPESSNTNGSSTTSGTITISPATISIASATVQDKTYDGGTDATVGTVTFTGLVNGESLTSGTDYTATAAFTDKNAGDSKQATVTVTLQNGNYTFANSEKTATANATAKISPLAVALSWSTPTSFTYDGTEKSVTATITNAVSGDDVGLDYGTSTTTATAANEYTATVSGLSGNDANNYTLTGADNLSQSWSIGGASIAGATVELSGTAFTYNGQSQKPTVTVKLNGNTLNANTDYTVDFGGDSINAGTYTVTVTGKGNYSGTATSEPTYTINKAAQAALSITSSGPATFGQNYTLTTSGGSGSGAVTITVSNGTGAATVSGYTLTPSKAGTVTVTAVKAGDNNYNDGTSVSATITINKGTYDGTKTAAGSVLANWPGEVTLPAIPDGASYGEPSGNDATDMSITNGVLHYTGGGGIQANQQYTVTVPVAGATNYNDYQITVTLTGTDKKVLTITGVTAQNGTYNGQTQAGYTGTPSAQGYTGDFTVTYNTTDGKAPTNAGNYAVTIAIPDSDPQYVGSIVLEFTIAKKPLTVSAPSASVYVGDSAPELALTYTGLVASESVTPSKAPAFTITKSDDTEIALADAVQTAGTYTITWSNANQGFTGDENYDIQTVTAGTLTVSVRSSGGGGSSNTTTEITKNPDGSTTTTVTNKTTGTVTETTKFPDGSKEVVETKKDGTVTTTTTDTAGNKTEVVENTDGSSKTTVDNKDGSGSVTVVDENGQVVSEATLSQSAVAAAQEKGEAVTLPMPEVPVTTDRENAPTVTVDLPSGTSAKVEIPVADVTPGTVAVIVKADGTEEVIKTSLTTENGVAVTLSDGDTVKVVDNSKTFDDVSDNYWGAEAVAFASSRELFAGTSATTFAPDTAMTRAMIVTVLARFEGVDTTTGSTWYEAGQQWAVQNGVSDGTNMDQGLSREQLATMLWRYAGSPSVSNSLSGYTDAGTVSSYAQQAMARCVEQGIIGGTTTTTLSPQGPATRAQVATILMRYIENIA